MPYLEVSLLVDETDLAEIAGEIISRHILSGVLFQATRIVHDPDSSGRAIGPYRVCGYIPVDENLEAARQQIEEGLADLRRRHSISAPEFHPLEEINWVETWKERYLPIPLGRSLIILPEWLDNPEPARIPVKIDPGMAFGTGTHATTQLALQLVAETLTPGASLIDIGSGSGILTIAAAKLGARGLLGVDNDPDAETNAQGNAALNGVADQIEFATASLGDILSGQFARRQADLVVANILTHILIQLLDEGLHRLIAPGGLLILSGILVEREAEMLAALDKHALDILDRRQMLDWVALLVAPKT